ncbi:MAG: SpoIIE family protein phosphatase [Bryobacteraceae bacterium]|jgi:sigma-B regulation protein RsbU (phosphoserine phosphatase)
MRIAYREVWRRLGRIEKTFLVLVALYALLKVTGLSPSWRFAIELAGFAFGLTAFIRFARVMMRKAIWRLRNRLIVAYLFIAVVPIVLILMLAGLACYALLGQVGVYFVRTQLANKQDSLLRQAEILAGVRPNGGRGGGGRGGGRGYAGLGGPGGPGAARAGQASSRGNAGFPAPGLAGRGRSGGLGPPGGSASTARDRLNFVAPNLEFQFPDFEILITGTDEIRLPANSKLTAPPPEWGLANGLIFKPDSEGQQRLYMWAHVRGSAQDAPGAQDDVREVTILWPLTGEVLMRLEPRLPGVGIISLEGTAYVPESREAHLPKAVSVFDITVSGLASGTPLQVAYWDSHTEPTTVLLELNMRASSVLGIIFERRAGQRFQMDEIVQTVFLGFGGLLLLAEIASLWVGVKITRSMTGAVHEIYEGTQRIKGGDFTYRIPVKGDDQLAELGSSFNTMSDNLGQLIVVAKEKERLQSELEIAHEVQAQLFPRDVPTIKSLELKGVCRPARVVSGDYYDFLVLPDAELVFAIGDVAGKGISAALLMATIQSTVRTQLGGVNGSGPKHLSAAGLVSQLNRQLFANTAPEKYATFFLALYDEPNSRLTYTNAGHLPPILVRSNQCISLAPTGTVVGAFQFSKYEERSIALEKGDVLVAYTDGIVEPENSYGEMFGENRMKDLYLRYAHADSSEIIARTMEAVVQWTGSPELQDDMTMIVARRT